MPRFVAITSDVLFPRKVTQDETIIGKQGMDFGEDFLLRNHLVVIINHLAVHHQANIHRESRMVLGIAGDCHILPDIIRSVFFGKFFDYLLLAGDTPINGVQLNLYALFQQSITQLHKMSVGFTLDLELTPHGIFCCNERDICLIIVREFMGFVHQD